MQIVTYPEAVLRKVAEPVAQIDGRLQTQIDEMIALLYQRHGLGLAAPQVGQSLCLFVYDLSIRDADAEIAGRPEVLINPQIIAMEGEQIGEEGCLSLPGYFEPIKRAKRVQLRGMDREGREVSLEAEDLMARLFQHEVDHLNGVMMMDHWSHLKREMLLRQFKKPKVPSR